MPLVATSFKFSNSFLPISVVHLRICQQKLGVQGQFMRSVAQTRITSLTPTFFSLGVLMAARVNTHQREMHRNSDHGPNVEKFVVYHKSMDCCH